MEHHRLKKWEIALVLALGLSLCWGLVFGETEGCAWWGVMYPELTQSADAAAQTFAAPTPARVQLRSRLWEWLTAWLAR